MPASRRRMPKEGTVSAIKGPEVLSEENVRERGRIVGKIKQTFEPIKRRGPKKEKKRKGKKGLVPVRVTRKDGVISTIYVNPEELRTNPKYANLREDIRVAPGYKAMKNKPVLRRWAMVPYDEDFARRQRPRPQRKLSSDEKKRIERDAMLDRILVTIKRPKDLIEEKLDIGESKAYKRIEQKGIEEAERVKNAFDEKSKTEEKKKKEKVRGGGGGRFGWGTDAGEMLKLVFVIIILAMVLGMISWIINMF